MQVWRDRWRALQRLTGSERRSAVAALGALILVRLTLAALGFRRTQALLSRHAEVARGTAPAPPPDRPAAERIVRAVDRAAGCGPGFLRPSCLPRSLTLWWLLRRAGQPAELRIGVRRAADRLEAHAWVELEGRVLGDLPDVQDRFRAFEGPLPEPGGKRPTGPLPSRHDFRA